MSENRFKIVYTDRNGDRKTAFHDSLEIFNEHKRVIVDDGGEILESKNPVIKEGMQILSE